MALWQAVWPRFTPGNEARRRSSVGFGTRRVAVAECPTSHALEELGRADGVHPQPFARCVYLFGSSPLVRPLQQLLPIPLLRRPPTLPAAVALQGPAEGVHLLMHLLHLPAAPARYRYAWEQGPSVGEMVGLSTSQ